MNRLLRIVDYRYGDATRKRVFEPLLADFASEIHERESLVTFALVGCDRVDRHRVRATRGVRQHVGWSGWRLGTPRLETYSSVIAETWLRVVMVASVLQISVSPLGLALKMGYNGLWPNHFLVTYVAGFAMYPSMRP